MPTTINDIIAWLSLGISAINVIVAGSALAIAAGTAWLTLLKKGTVRMTRPTKVFFGYYGSNGPPKISIHSFLYCTAQRGRVVENMFAKVHRGESIQNFNIWMYGDELLGRASGIFVDQSGVASNYHFLVPENGVAYEFLPGEYVIDIYATLVGDNRAILLKDMHLALSELHVATLKEKRTGISFEWGPDSKKYHAQVDEPPKLPSVF